MDYYDTGPTPGVYVTPLKTALTVSKGKPPLAVSFLNQHQAEQGSLSVSQRRPSSRNVCLAYPVKGLDFPSMADLVPRISYEDRYINRRRSSDTLAG